MSAIKFAAPGDLVEVEWYDSERVTLGWAEAQEYLDALADRMVYRTAGYLVGETDDHIAISPSRSGAGLYSDAMVIPHAVIHSWRRLSPEVDD